MRLLAILGVIVASAACLAEEKPVTPQPAAPAPDQQEVFVANQDGYNTYRIPSVLVTAKGTILAFCEGRKTGRGDSGNIDVVLKRSLDGGQTWQPMQIVADDEANTFGNPCPVQDRDTGTIWLPLTHNLGTDTESAIAKRTAKGSRTVWMTKSTDDGATWAKPVEITAATKRDNWTWYATGPGCGIQMKSGRMVIPCDHNAFDGDKRESHAIYSDDHGATWKLGGTITGNVNECQVAELADGSLLMNMRSYSRRNLRAVSTSRDGGLTWTPAADDPALIEPVCQAALIRMADPRDPARGILVFSNPASKKREKMTVRISTDEGKTWPVSGILHAGPAAYSALGVLPDGRILCLYERGEKSAYEKITLARFPLQWLLHSQDVESP